MSEAEQSSDLVTGESSAIRAVDGDYATVARTSARHFESWRTDLGKEIYVASIITIHPGK